MEVDAPYGGAGFSQVLDRVAPGASAPRVGPRQIDLGKKEGGCRREPG